MHWVRSQEAEPALNAAVLENYSVMVGLYARLGVAPGLCCTRIQGTEQRREERTQTRRGTARGRYSINRFNFLFGSLV